MASNQLPKPLDDLFTLAEDMADGCHTATPYLAAYTGAQAGQMVYYWLRWVNPRGEKGPWSEAVSATIAG